MMKGVFKKDWKVKGVEVDFKTEKFVRGYFNFPGGGIEYLEKQKKCSKLDKTEEASLGVNSWRIMCVVLKLERAPESSTMLVKP